MRKLLVLLILSLFLFIQTPAQKPDVWQPLRPLIGEWTGSGEGEPGKGAYERSYKFVLGDKFIEIKNKTTYQPQPKNPKGEVHEDVGYISYDKARKIFVMRQFHKEGFVNQYKLESISEDGKTLVFVSESIENIPAGFRAKETYRFSKDGAFTETFEMAGPDKDFGVYTKASFTKNK